MHAVKRGLVKISWEVGSSANPPRQPRRCGDDFTGRRFRVCGGAASGASTTTSAEMDVLFREFEPFWPSPLDPQLEADRPPLEWDGEQWRRLFQRTASFFGDRYADAYLIVLLSARRLAQALRSPDPITQSLAFAAFHPQPEPAGEQPPPAAPAASSAPGGLIVSTMIHGTWGWKGSLWRPSGDFHDYILRNYRPNLYSRGAKFSWSGAYSDSQRNLAADDFRDWAYDVAPHGLQTVFAHSYGAEVAARAAQTGVRLHECVLLSAPVTAPVRGLPRTSCRVVDIRLRFDPILAIAGVLQRLDSPNVTEILLNRWRLGHGSTHDPAVWQYEDIARRAKL